MALYHVTQQHSPLLLDVTIKVQQHQYSYLHIFSYQSILHAQAANEDNMMRRIAVGKRLAAGSFSLNGRRILKRTGFELVSVHDGEHDLYCLDVDRSELTLQ